MDPLCRNFAVTLQRRRLLSHHYWPGGENFAELPPLYFSCFLQALSAVSQPVYQILAPKYSERWFDLKGRTTATMIISIGIDSFSRNGIPTTDQSSSQRILSVVGWASYCHQYIRIPASRYVHIQLVTAVSMSTWHGTSKILALAIISTAVVPLDLLIAEAPPTPPSRDSLSSYVILWSES